MTSVDAPPPRDYGQETRDTLQAQIDLAPDRYAAEAEYRPKYAALDLQSLQTALRGSGGTPGLLDLYRGEIQPVLSEVEAADRQARIAGELGALTQYAPQVTRTLREASGNAPIVDELNRQALSQLQAGTELDPALANQVAQSARAAQAARGFGFGAPDATVEAFALGERGAAQRAASQAFAGQVAGLNQATGGDPLMTILGRPSQTLGMGQNVISQAGALNPGSQFNPESSYASDVFNTNFNADAAARIATGNNQAAITSAAIGAGGSIASSL